MSDVILGRRYEGTVVSTVIEQDRKQQTFINATFGIEDETHSKRIYLTEKAMGMARAQLKAMGFDCDKRSLKELDENPLLLAGNKVELDFKTWESREGAVLQLDGIYPQRVPMEGDFLSKLDSALRGVKKDNSKGEKAKPTVSSGGTAHNKETPSEAPPKAFDPKEDDGIPF